MTAYYNEIDPYAAQWLRNLIDAGHIAPGYVDERSIEDVYPSDLRGFTQCHFFAGIGVWSYALRRAGWRDDRPIWTGSCPCQPFSAAGKGAGFDDERHLWPAFHHLIRECKPAIVLGEQVASKDADPWIDLVHADLEAMGYAFGSVPFPAAGVGAPHIRDRLYWVADASGAGLERRHHRAMGNECAAIERSGEAGGVADSDFARLCGEQGLRIQGANLHDANGRRPVGGFWSGADWIPCRDGKWRPVEPGTFPLVDGTAGRMGRVRSDQERLTALVPRKDQGSRIGRLKGYGNAINAEAARVFIECVMDCSP